MIQSKTLITWCQLGFHKWEFRDEVDTLFVFTYARCTNDECKFHTWQIVNYDKRYG